MKGAQSLNERVMRTDWLQVIKDELIRLDPAMAGDEESESFRAAVLVFAAAYIGANVDDLVAFTAYPRDFVACISQRMRNCGLWDDGFVSDDWYIERTFEDQIILPFFWTHVLAALGLVTVIGHDQDGRRIFAAVDNGPAIN
jgi:hypothetical protein